jgi:hypothetical protein
MRRRAKDGIQFQNRFRQSNKRAIIIITNNGCNTTREVCPKSVEGRNRRETTDKKTNADFNVETEASRLQLRKSDSPFGYKVRDSASNANGVVEGIQEFGAIRKITGAVVLSQGLID